MRIRIVFVIFILTIIGVQFLIPRKNTIIKPQENNTGDIIQIQETINFLGDNINIDINNHIIDTQKINSYQEILQTNKIPTDFAYLFLYNEENNIKNIPDIYLEDIIINEKIDQRLDQTQILQKYSNYLKDLYKESKSRKITAVASQIGINNTKKILVDQKEATSNNMYFGTEIEKLFTTCASWKKQFQDLPKQTQNYTLTEIREIKNIVKRSKEEKINNKSFRFLNPRILTNELPKKDDGKRTIKIPK